MLVRFENDTLEATHQVIRQSELSLSKLEKWAIAHSALIYNDSGFINLDEAQDAIQKMDKARLNELFRQSEIDWHHKLRSDMDVSSLSVNIDLSCWGDFTESAVHFMAKFTGGGEGIDLQPLEYLSDSDGAAVADALAEIKQLYIDAPTAQSLEDYAGMYEEVIDLFEKWLPANLRQGTEADIYAYYEKHSEKFAELAEEETMWGGYEDVVDDYIMRRKPMPKWFDRIEQGIGRTDPWKAVERVEKHLATVQHSQVKAFLIDVIAMTKTFLRHFDNAAAWKEYVSSSGDNRSFIESDEPYIEIGYMLTWGGHGYWWDICAEIHNMMMQAGETPTQYLDAEGAENRKLVPLVYEQLAIGDSLLLKLGELSYLISLDASMDKVA